MLKQLRITHKRAASLDQFHQSANTGLPVLKHWRSTSRGSDAKRQPDRVIRVGVQQAQCSTNSKIVDDAC
jgi:hypothetical protein